jgi:glucokinase
MSGKIANAGIDIGGTNIKFGLVDTSGKVLYREQRPTLVEKGADPLMHLITNISEGLLYHAAEEEYEVRWLGIGTPGAVDIKTGTVIGPCPNIAGWQGMEIGKILRDRLNTPVYVENDANVMALAEARFGAAIGYKSVV